MCCYRHKHNFFVSNFVPERDKIKATSQSELTASSSHDALEISSKHIYGQNLQVTYYKWHRNCSLLGKGVNLKIFLARTSRTSHFKSILSLLDDSLFLRGKFPLSNSFPFLLTLLSIELMNNLFDIMSSVPPRFERGFFNTGEETVAR